jgi:hypothetical protein
MPASSAWHSSAAVPPIDDCGYPDFLGTLLWMLLPIRCQTVVAQRRPETASPVHFLNGLKIWLPENPHFNHQIKVGNLIQKEI